MLAIIKSSLFAIYIYMCKQYFIILMQFFHLFAIFFSLSLIASCNELLLCKFERKKGEYFTACLQKCMVWQCQKSSFCNKVKMFLNSSIEMQKKLHVRIFVEAVSWKNEAPHTIPWELIPFCLTCPQNISCLLFFHKKYESFLQLR